MKILITGISGLVGMEWTKIALRKKWEVIGLSRTNTGPRGIPNSVKIIPCDILDRPGLESVIKKTQPTWVIHLAAQSFNSISWYQEELTHQINYMGTMNLLQVVRRQIPHAKVLLAGTSVSYGVVKPEQCPIIESTPLNPTTPYGVSKAAAELLGYQYHQNFGLQVYLPRLFAQLGLGNTPNNAVHAFARQLALIHHRQLEPIIHTGNLETSRDFLDIRDGVKGMLTLLENGPAGKPVNICSGKPLPISELLQTLIEVSGLQVEIKIDTSKIRPTDEPIVYGDNSFLKSLGWSPRISLQESLFKIYEDWKTRMDLRIKTNR